MQHSKEKFKVLTLFLIVLWTGELSSADDGDQLLLARRTLLGGNTGSFIVMSFEGALVEDTVQSLKPLGDRFLIF